MEEIYPDIYCITEKGFARNMTPPVNIYIIAGRDGLMFDAGYGRAGSLRFIMKELQEIKARYARLKREFAVTRILPSHTHADHFSGASALRKKLGASIMLTAAMAEKLRSREAYMMRYEKDRFPSLEQGGNLTRNLKRRGFDFLLTRYFEKLYGTGFIPDPDIIIEEKTKIVIGGEPWLILPTPGHMTDHISLYEPDRGVLLGGDNILKNITTWLGPPDSDLDEYIKSLENIRDLPGLKTILSAHGAPVTNPIERIDELIAWRRERLDHVIEIIDSSGSRGITLRELVAALYPAFNPKTRYLARGWIRLSVKYLEKNGVIESRIDRERIFRIQRGKPDF